MPENKLREQMRQGFLPDPTLEGTDARVVGALEHIAFELSELRRLLNRIARAALPSSGAPAEESDGN